MQRPAEPLGEVDAELVRADCLFHRTLLFVWKIDLMPRKKLLDLILVTRLQRLARELLFIGGKAAVFAHPYAIAVRVHSLIVNAVVLISLKRDQARFHLRHVRLFPTDRTRFFHRICIL